MKNGWEAKKIIKIADIVTGKRDVNEGDKNGKYPFFTCAKTPFKINEYEFDDKAILVAGNGDFNVKYYEGKFNAYQRTYVIKNIKIHPKYLYHYISYKLSEIVKDNRGSTIRYIRLGNLTEHSVPFPSDTIQQIIVEKLDSLFSSLDAAERELKKVQEQLDVYRQSILKHAFANTSVNGQLLKIENIAKVETGATPKRGNARFWTNGTIPWITSSCVNQKVVTEYSEMITEAALKETNAKVFPIGTIIVAMYGEGKTRGKFTELGIEAATNQACAAIILKEEYRYLKEYLKLFLLMNYQAIRLLSAGGVQPNLNLSMIKKTKLIIPKEDDAYQIVAIVKTHLSVLDNIEKIVKANLSKTKYSKQSILKKAFSGELAS